MKLNKHSLRTLLTTDTESITDLTKHLNPTISTDILKDRQMQMFNFETYTCFGLYMGDMLMGVASGWFTVRLYSGKQLEIDNIIINPSIQSKGHGKIFVELIEKWALKNNCETIELNTYVQNSRSHKFYFNEGFKILGFHFQKIINR